jgi:preprotein translocase subunit SecA
LTAIENLGFEPTTTEGIVHNVLNARQHEQEAQIVALMQVSWV